MTKPTCYNMTVRVAPCPIVPVGEVEVIAVNDTREIGVAHFGRQTAKGLATCEHYGLFAREGNDDWRPIMSTIWQPIRAEKLSTAKDLLLKYGPKLTAIRPAELLHALSMNFLTEHGYDLSKHLVVPEAEQPEEVAA